MIICVENANIAPWWQISLLLFPYLFKIPWIHGRVKIISLIPISSAISAFNERMVNFGNKEFLKSLFWLLIRNEIDLMKGLVDSLLVAVDDDAVVAVPGLGDGDLGGGLLF